MCRRSHSRSLRAGDELAPPQAARSGERRKDAGLPRSRPARPLPDRPEYHRPRSSKRAVFHRRRACRGRALLLALLDDPGWVTELLGFTAEVAKAYGRAFHDRGLGVILFDSHAAPPLVPPRLYEEVVLPATASVISYFRTDLGIPLVPYIMGGDTGRLLDLILATGSNNILCDFRADLASFVSRLAGKPVLLRANIDPRFLLSASPEEIRARTREVLAVGRRHPGFLLGTGILPYDILPEKVIAVRDALDEK